MEYFLQGLTMGLVYVAPIGMQNLFVINSALSRPLKKSMITAWIVIFFDVTLSLACFFGIGVILSRLQLLKLIILLIGGMLVVYIGVGLLRKNQSVKVKQSFDYSTGKIISTACIVTWFNPQAIIDGTMMLAAFQVVLPPDGSIKFLIGVALASILWFNGLVLMISHFRNRFDDKILRYINIICGLAIVGYGIKLIVDFIKLIM